ncbi:MAG: DUF2188 domain-containing protein [bacterium]
MKQAPNSIRFTPLDHGRELADNNRPAPLIIHDRNGQIRDERTYGQDPEDPPG